MPRVKREAPFTAVERTFFKAIDRLEKGKFRAGKRIKINVTNVSLEAGYARSYLYKLPLPRVMARIRSCMGAADDIRTSRDLISRLRDQRNRATVERDLAMDAARRWMQRCQRLQEELLELEKANERRLNRERKNAAPHEAVDGRCG